MLRAWESIRAMACSAADRALEPAALHDHDAPAGRRVDVDVVDAGAGPPHHLQAVGPGDQVGGDLGGAAHHQGVVGRDAVEQLVLGPVQAAC